MTRCFFISLVLAILCGLTPEIATAQSANPPARPAAAAKPVGRDGKEIRVTMRSGERRSGRLVSLTSAEVVMTWGKDNAVIPLREVRRIETVSHHARMGAMLGLFAGIGWALGVCGSAESPCGGDGPAFSETALFLGGGVAGIGAAVGGILNSATKHRPVIFENRSGPVASVSPILGGGKAGVAVRLRWNN